MSFRKLEKDTLQIEAPVEISELVREKAFRDRISISAAATALLCMGLKRDPKRYGIEPRRKTPVTAA